MDPIKFDILRPMKQNILLYNRHHNKCDRVSVLLQNRLVQAVLPARGTNSDHARAFLRPVWIASAIAALIAGPASLVCSFASHVVRKASSMVVRNVSGWQSAAISSVGEDAAGGRDAPAIRIGE